MALIFPVPPQFPACNWVDDFVPGESATIKQQFANLSVSRLKISELSANAKFTAHWDELTYAQTQAFLDFWESVGTFESFTLPLGFWDTKMSADKRSIYTRLSPTGLWMFSEIPKFTDINLSVQSIVATFSGTID